MVEKSLFYKRMSLLAACALFGGLAVTAQAADGAQQSVLSLTEATGKALQNSPRLGAAAAALRAADGALRQAGAWNNPELGVDMENLAGTGPYKGTRSAEYTYNLSQRVELGGKRASRRNVAGAEKLAVDRTLQATRLDIIHDVTIAYGEVLVAQEKLRLAEEREKLAQDVLKNVSSRVNAARDPLIYKSQADVALATATLELQQAGRALKLAQRKLAAMWGDENLALPLDASILHAGTAPQGVEVYLARLADNPDLQRYASLIDARKAALRLEKAQNVPDPAVSVGLRNFRENGEQAMLLGVSVPLPVFNRNGGGIAKAGAQITETEQEARTAGIAAEQALHENWQDWQSAYTEERELEKSILPAARTALRLSREGYERGRFSFLEVLNAQRTLADAEGQHVEALQRQLAARAGVERLTATAEAPILISPTTVTGDQ